MHYWLFQVAISKFHVASSSVNTMRTQCKHNAKTVWTQCKHHANTVQTNCEHSLNTMRTQWSANINFLEILSFFIFSSLILTFYKVSTSSQITCRARRSRDLARKTRHVEFSIFNLNISTTLCHIIWHFNMGIFVFNLLHFASKCSAFWSMSFGDHFPTKFVHFEAISFLMFTT